MFKPASRSTLYENVIEQIIQAIKKGIWKPGSRMDGEMVLAEKFQVSRSSIREAMKALSLQNIVESKPGHGTFIASDALRKIANQELVNSLGEDVSLKEKVELRVLIELQTVEWVTLNATEEGLDELEIVLEEDIRNVDIFRETLLQTRARFHDKMAEIAGNGLIVKLLRTTRMELEAHRHNYLVIPEQRWNRMMEDHRSILRLIRARNVEKAKKAMYDHLTQGLEDTLGCYSDSTTIQLEDTLLHM